MLLKPEFVGQISEHVLRNYAAHAIETAGVSRYGVLLQVRFVKTLVKTSVGKMNKRLMRADPAALCLYFGEFSSADQQGSVRPLSRARVSDATEVHRIVAMPQTFLPGSRNPSDTKNPTSRNAAPTLNA